MTATGWTWGEVDDMTIPQVQDLTEYWRTQPPTHVLVAAYLGLKPEGPRRLSTEAEVMGAVGMFNRSRKR